MVRPGGVAVPSVPSVRGSGWARLWLAMFLVVLTSIVVAVAAPAALAAGPTELTFTSTGNGQAVKGYIAPAGSTFDPSAQPAYPTSPPAGFTTLNEGFAGIINAKDPSGNSFRMYCIDIHTLTNPGDGYVLGTWDSGNVPLVGYVARILNEYYPNTNLPTAGGNVNLRAAAVQAAIWYFSDKYVLRSDDAAFPSTQGIVNDVLAKGPLTEPPAPSLSFTPPTSTVGPVGSAIGPFTVNTTAPATLSVTGGTMWANAATTTPVTNPVSDGQKVWLKSTALGTITLSATAIATVPSGNVYLYSGNTGKDAAQKLILAEDATLKTTVSTTASTFDTGTLKVTKVIAGDGAGLQGEVVIGVVCNGTPLADFTVSAGATAGSYSATYGEIVTPATCVLTERTTGANATVSVTTPSPVTVTLPQNTTPGDVVTGTMTDTFTQNPGSLTVTKTIVGGGSQDPITIDVSCGPDGSVLKKTITIPAGATSTPPVTYSGIPAGTQCTVTETSSGGNAANSVTVDPDAPITVTVPAGGSAPVAITNTFASNPGSLLVTKTITGTGKALRGDVTIDVDCDNNTTASFTIPAGTDPDPAGYLVDGLPVGTTCTVTESDDGGNAKVAVTTVVGAQTPSTVPAGGQSTVAVTNTYTTNPGKLTVTKTITGDGADLRGDVTIQVDCTNGLSQTVTIPAGTDPEPTTFDGLPAGTECTVTETADGSTDEADVVVDPSGPQTVTVPAGGSETVALTDTYTQRPGSLTITKAIAGDGAALRGDVVIDVTCSDGTTGTLSVPRGQSDGTLTLTDLPGGTTCSLVETSNGNNSLVTVVTSETPSQVTIPPGGTTTVPITDTYSLNPGGLRVTKLMTGLGLGQQGPVSIHVSCGPGGSVLDDTIDVPAGATSVEPVTYQVPAGTECTVSETADGATSTIAVVASVSPADPVTIEPAAVTDVTVADQFNLIPGSIRVTKTITGTAAGQQGDIAVHVECDPGDHVPVALPDPPDFTIPAGATSFEPVVYPNITPGIPCTVTETANGSTSTVTVVSTVEPAGSQTIEPAHESVWAITNTVSEVGPDVGDLVVRKTITGDGAGLQDGATIEVTCDDGTSQTLSVPAGASSVDPLELSDLPVGTTCTVTESADGANDAVTVSATVEPSATVIVAAGTSTVTVTNTYTKSGGELPFTGNDSQLMLLVAGGLLTVGALFVRLSSVRSRRQD